MTDEQIQALVKECGLDWQRGYMPLFDGDPTNRYSVLVEAATAPLLERIAALEKLSVTNIMLSIEPGYEGMGEEVFAKSVADVEKKLGDMGEELEDWQLGIKRHPEMEASIAALEAKLAQRVPDVDALTDKIASLLSGTYHCMRVWDAWHVGTMSQDDFEPVDESETPREIAEEIHALLSAAPAAPEQQEPTPIDMVLHCPACGMQHVDAPEKSHYAIEDDEPPMQWDNPPHRSHLCHDCGHVWRPADVPTNGVAAVKTKGKADSPVSQAPNAQQADNWLHLKGYGYAPGDYMNKCHRCEKVVHGVDKRATTCRPCAEAMHGEAMAQQAEAQEPFAFAYEYIHGKTLLTLERQEDWREHEIQLFTSPQPAQLQALSEEETVTAWRGVKDVGDDKYNAILLGEAIQSALAAKNGAVLK